MGQIEDILKKIGVGFCCLAVVCGIITIITVLASIKTLGREEQMIIKYLDGKSVVNGPCTKVFNPFRQKEIRKATRLGHLNYILIQDALGGLKRVEEGPKLVFMEAYENHDGIKSKIVLKKDQYIRFVDRLSGNERVVSGPDSVTPGPWEESNDGVQQASFVNRDSAVIVLNKEDGTKRLESRVGVFFPRRYEVVVETRKLVRVLPHETMVVRDALGKYIIKSGAGASGAGSGTAFFLEPFEEILEMDWSTFSEPPEGGLQTMGYEKVGRIDMRARKVFFQYDVRTNDNVALRIEGTIFWHVADVGKLLNRTADPAGDVWYKARSVLIGAVSKVDLETFMESFNPLIQDAFTAQAQDAFYMDRGLEVHSMEVTKYDPTDEVTALTLQEIIEETTNRINQLQKQRSENDVKAAKLLADIKLEEERTKLIETQSANEKLVSMREGEAQGVKLAMSASSFMDSLNSSLPDVDQRLKLYNLHKQLENKNERTKFISSGKATTLFLSADDINLNLNTNEL